MKIQFSVFLSVFVLFLGGAEYRIGDRAGMPWIMRDGIPVSPRMVYVSRTAQEIATVGPQWKEFTLRFSILKSCDNAAFAFFQHGIPQGTGIGSVFQNRSAGRIIGSCGQVVPVRRGEAGSLH